VDVTDEGGQVNDEGDGRIELSIPARPNLLHLVRLTAGVVAGRADLGFDEVEDLRLAVDELCLPFIGPTGHQGRLLLRYRWDGEVIEISCTLTAEDEGVEIDGTGVPEIRERAIKGQAERLRDELSGQILDALVAEHGETTINGRATVWLRMTRPGAENA
jgi:hypothetical protein